MEHVLKKYFKSREKTAFQTRPNILASGYRSGTAGVCKQV